MDELIDNIKLKGQRDSRKFYANQKLKKDMRETNPFKVLFNKFPEEMSISHSFQVIGTTKSVFKVNRKDNVKFSIVSLYHSN